MAEPSRYSFFLHFLRLYGLPKGVAVSDDILAYHLFHLVIYYPLWVSICYFIESCRQLS